MKTITFIRSNFRNYFNLTKKEKSQLKIRLISCILLCFTLQVSMAQYKNVDLKLNKKSNKVSENLKIKSALPKQFKLAEQSAKVKEFKKSIEFENLMSSTPTCFSIIDFADVNDCVANVDNGDGSMSLTFSPISCTIQPEMYESQPIDFVSVSVFEIYYNGTFQTSLIEGPTSFGTSACNPITFNFPVNHSCFEVNGGTFEVIASLMSFQIINGVVADNPFDIIPFTNCINETFTFTIYPDIELQVSDATDCSTVSVNLVSPDGTICGSNSDDCTANNQGFVYNYIDPDGCRPEQIDTAFCSGCIPGCTNSILCNYDPNATIDDGSCGEPIFNDWDCDGVQIFMDCDDYDPTVGSNVNDFDCDGVVTFMDCDDYDPTVGSNANDFDCDGVQTFMDCDDYDPTVGILEVTDYTLDQNVCLGNGINLIISGTPNAIVNVTLSNAGTYNTTINTNGIASFGVTANANLYTLTINSISLNGCTEDLSYLAPITSVVSDCTNDCSNAIAVNCGDVVYGNNTNFPVADFPDCLYGSTPYNFQGLWYEYLGDGNDLTVSTCGALTDFNTLTYIYEGACSNLTCVGFDDDFCGANSGDEVTITTVPGTIYSILIAGFSIYDIGNFEVAFTCGNNCAPDLTLNANPEITGTYNADNWIESTSKVNTSSGGIVNYQAGDEYILLNNGFDANGAVNFNAEIIDCDTNN